MITADEMKQDWDWQCAFHEACVGGYDYQHNVGPVSNVVEVLHADPGENDGDDWIAIVKWGGPEGAFAVMSAGCDYTGWD